MLLRACISGGVLAHARRQKGYMVIDLLISVLARHFSSPFSGVSMCEVELWDRIAQVDRTVSSGQNRDWSTSSISRSLCLQYIILSQVYLDALLYVLLLL